MNSSPNPGYSPWGAASGSVFTMLSRTAANCVRAIDTKAVLSQKKLIVCVSALSKPLLHTKLLMAVRLISQGEE